MIPIAPYVLSLFIMAPGGIPVFYVKPILNTNGLVAQAVAPPKQTVTVSWRFPNTGDSSGLAFRVRHSANTSLPLKDWPVLTNVPGMFRSATIRSTNKQGYFTVTASNWMGETKYATK